VRLDNAVVSDWTALLARIRPHRRTLALGHRALRRDGRRTDGGDPGPHRRRPLRREPHGSIGARFVNGPGALTLNQLNTGDPEAAERFYAGLFGWRVEQVQGGDQPYWGIYNGERLNAGMMRLPPDAGAPPHWLVYFGSEDVDADAGRIGELGGVIILPPLDVPGGRILVAQDPQGAIFGLFAGRFDD
jgi:uncharacterized protein